ncbi:MAG TPA: ATP-binding cassette domain-containing protein [Candidatus Methanoperedens sp.]|nr:ATP-binding cassette domain-containing protein [Candidatus Methanoperedens sp.]
MKIDVGDRVLLTYLDREPVEFRVKGIISTGTFELDRYAIIATYDTVKELIEKKEATNIVIRLEKPEESAKYKLLLQKETTLPNVKTWQELSAGMAGMIETFGVISVMTSGVSVFVAAIAISLIIYTTVRNKIRQIGVLNMIGLLDTPTSGGMLVDGIEVSSLDENSRADFRLKKMGFVFQFFSLLMELNSLENVALPMIMDKRKYDRANSLLELVGIGDRAAHYPSELSGGQQQRVAIARALANEPVILLADEPTANLDTESSNQIVGLFRELNEKGQTIVMVTHELELGEKADRIIRIKDGKVV